MFVQLFVQNIYCSINCVGHVGVLLKLYVIGVQIRPKEVGHNTDLFGMHWTFLDLKLNDIIPNLKFSKYYDKLFKNLSFGADFKLQTALLKPYVIRAQIRQRKLVIKVTFSECIGCSWTSS